MVFTKRNVLSIPMEKNSDSHFSKNGAALVTAMSAVHHTSFSERHTLTVTHFFPLSIFPSPYNLFSRVLLAEKGCLNICNCDLI